MFWSWGLHFWDSFFHILKQVPIYFSCLMECCFSVKHAKLIICSVHQHRTT